MVQEQSTTAFLLGRLWFSCRRLANENQVAALHLGANSLSSGYSSILAAEKDIFPDLSRGCAQAADLFSRVV